MQGTHAAGHAQSPNPHLQVLQQVLVLCDVAKHSIPAVQQVGAGGCELRLLLSGEGVHSDGGAECGDRELQGSRGQ